MKFGGPPLKIHALSRGLVARGHRLRVATFNSERCWDCREVEIDGVAVQYSRWLGWRLRQLPLSLGKLRHLISQADVVHCSGLYNSICPLAARFAHNGAKPLVIEPLGMYRPRGSNQLAKRIYHSLFTKGMLMRADAVIATSAAEMRELRGAVNGSKLALRRNGIDTEAFQKLPSGARFREQFKIAEDEKLILFLGRISPIKNLEMLVEAFSVANLPNCHLVLAGPRSESGYFHKLKRLALSSCVNRKAKACPLLLLTGPIFGEDKLAALAAADLFVLPSLSESFGIAAAEAVAAGVPVLLTETCGLAPIIHRRAGLAVPLGVESLIRGLRSMILDESLRDSTTSQRDEVIKELSWEQPLNQTEELYKRLANANSEARRPFGH
jgi:glycosyltransferase involved in cell wall biosynthesis